MAKLFLMLGPTCAGKTTYSRRVYPAHWILNFDEIREDLGESDQELVFRALYELAKTRLLYDLPTVIDAWNLERSARLRFTELSEEVVYVVIDRPLPEKLKSLEGRSENVVRECPSFC